MTPHDGEQPIAEAPGVPGPRQTPASHVTTTPRQRGSIIRVGPARAAEQPDPAGTGMDRSSRSERDGGVPDRGGFAQ